MLEVQACDAKVPGSIGQYRSMKTLVMLRKAVMCLLTSDVLTSPGVPGLRARL
jgi:hypothetical protein